MASRVTGAAATVVVAALALAGCSSGSTDAAASAGSDGTVNTVLWYAPSDFDPATSASSPDYTVARLGFDTLLRKGDDGYVGGLASDWEATSASSYTFTIRDGATCSDGTAITAQVVADSLERLATSTDSGAQNWTSLAFGSGTPTFTADDTAGTLTVDLSEPYSQLLGGVTLEGTGIVCPAGLADPDGLAAGTVAGAFSGPYTISAQQAGVSVSYALRDDYDAWPQWEGVTGTAPSTINITVETDPNTSANLLQSGGLDVANFYDANADTFTADDTYSYVTDNGTSNFLLFNEAPDSVFADDQELRAAAAAAVSATGFNDSAQDGLGEVLTSVASSDVECVLDGSSLLQAYDPTTASKTLTGKTIRMLAMTNWDTAVDYVAEALRAAGATVEVTKLDASEWSSTLRTDTSSWDMTLRAEIVSSGMVSQAIATKLGPSFAEGGTNYTSSDNAEGVKALDAALASDDATTTCTDLQEAQRTILERVDVAPLATSTHYIVARSGVAVHSFSGYWDIAATRLTA